VISLSDRHRDLLAKVMGEAASEDETNEFWRLHHLKSKDILKTAPEDLFDINRVAVPMPDTAEIHPSIACARCGEPVMETRLVDSGGQRICRECLENEAQPTASS
jgi:formylmethanofuran dehydrogenase subunit E